ncbi:histidine phosphatase family protein [Garciella nitratireducens]|uniref:Probable phosphoglycerate mutase n=1 Tax=Garciella nitratireducens DSM 15102 TaxID=1121911 RepID=A0A1T4JV27_9FIRM|nr:histidine phosphatase family protein [Garciella nitratireducens]RBP45595.1 putative phosphoglycerate mutase [Garciella nitratireducens]SJZ34060.1 probable phosphoglycerate mutase [Garciella nitratireducens DSM 15102]
MSRLYLIRHGETIWNRERKTQGIKNVSLSETGKLQAKYLAKRLKKENIDFIYSSDLSRAYKTAEIVGNHIGKSVQILPEIREMNFGDWEGLTLNEIDKKFHDIYNQWNHTPHLAKIPGGETLIQVQERAIKVVNRIIKKNPNKNIVMISHGTTIKTIIFYLLDIDLSYYKKIKQDNTAINIIDFKKEYNVLVKLNDTCHLLNLK